MSIQGWQETLVAAAAAGTNFNTYTAAKTVLPSGCLITLPANYWYVGRMMRITVVGGFSNLVTTPGTAALQIMHGTTVVFTSGNIQLNATAHTNLPFKWEVLLTCRAVGAAGNLMGQGVLDGIMWTLTAAQTDAANTSGRFMTPITAPAVGTNFDTTSAQILDFWVGFSISSASNGVQVQQYLVESLN